MSKTIFITGASSGIGKASAMLFASKGWKVIATMRNPNAEIELNRNENITLLPLDVTDLNQINDTVKKVISLGKVDVVLNNAGYGLVGPLEGTSDAETRKIINTNLLGVIRVTNAFIPHFRVNKSGVFISITSIGGLVSFPFFSLDHATKWALEGWTESMAFELNRFGISIKTVAPGATKTEFVGRSMIYTSHSDYNEYYDNYWKVFVSPDFLENRSTPETIAEVIYEASTDGKSQLRYIVGDDARESYAQRSAIGNEEFHKNLDTLFFE